MARAVHRLEGELALFAVRTGEEHVVAVVVVVARGDVRRDVVEQRRLHLDVAAAAVLAPAQILELVPDHHAFRVPERRPGRVVAEMEEVELVAEPAVVALAGELEPLEVGVEVLLPVEGGAVDARQLLVVGVAAPVGAGEPRELERLDRLRVLQVRAAAEVGELGGAVVRLRVEGDVSLGRVDELDLVRLTLRLEPPASPRRARSPRAPRRGPRFSSRRISSSIRSRSSSRIGSGNSKS